VAVPQAKPKGVGIVPNQIKRAVVPFFLGALFTIGCVSSGRNHVDEIAFVPHGPGAFFESIEDAAVDGLAHAYLRAQTEGNEGLMYGGKIRLEADGFTYDEVSSAKLVHPTVLRTELKKTDVARFHLYPRDPATRVNRMNERISRSDRSTVDRRDPAHRPLFVLTPRLSIIVYRGKGAPTLEIASLRPLPVRQQVAGH
jgi:hypothetical protein